MELLVAHLGTMGRVVLVVDSLDPRQVSVCLHLVLDGVDGFHGLYEKNAVP